MPARRPARALDRAEIGLIRPDVSREGDLLATWDDDLPDLGICAGGALADAFAGELSELDTVRCPGVGRLIDRAAAAAYWPWSERAPAVPLLVGL